MGRRLVRGIIAHNLSQMNGTRSRVAENGVVDDIAGGRKLVHGTWEIAAQA